MALARRIRMVSNILALSSVLASGPILAAPLFLVDTPFTSPQAVRIYSVDPATGVMTLRADLGPGYGPVLGLAAVDGMVLHGVGTDNSGTVCAPGETFACLLLRIELDPSSTVPVSVDLVGPIRVGAIQVEQVTALGFRSDGTLYGFNQIDDALFVIDPETAQASLVGVANIDLHGGDLTFDDDDRLWIWTNTGTTAGLYEMNPANGQCSLLDPEPGLNLAGLAAVGHTNMMRGASTADDQLREVDPLVGLTGNRWLLTLGGVRFDHTRGDLDSPFCENDAACSDSDPCTTDRCTAGGCRNELVDATCDGVDDDCDGLVDEDVDRDLDAVCDDLDNCPSVPNPGQDDADGDSIGDLCDPCPYDANGGCLLDGCHVDSDCDDLNDCTDDVCNAVSACLHTPVSGNPCSDGDACTFGDVCSSGVCIGNGPLSCDDGNACTRDSCDPAVGCVYAPAPTYSSIESSFNGTKIKAGNFIWFNSNFKIGGLKSEKTRVYLTNSSVLFAVKNGPSYRLAVPDAVITFDPGATCATTIFVDGRWETTVPMSGSDEIFLSALAFPVAADLPGGIKPVTWEGDFAADQPKISISWKWSAAVYTTDMSDYNADQVKPAHTNTCDYTGSDHAGTPMAKKGSVIGGARGGGGSNYTGSWSGTQTVKPNCP